MWAWVGKAATAFVLLVVAFTISAVLEAQWPEAMATVFEGVSEGLMFGGILWLVFVRWSRP